MGMLGGQCGEEEEEEEVPVEGNVIWEEAERVVECEH